MVTITSNTIMVRLSPTEIQAIKRAVLALDSQSQIYLFGSRVDVTKRGGDIDLLILSATLQYEDKLRIKKQLFEQLEEQKIDIVIAQDTSDPFVRIALQQGVKL
jgi:predicted nucleotidyltransferase